MAVYRNRYKLDSFDSVNNIVEFKLKDETDRWLRLNRPVKFSYFYSKIMLFKVD